MANSIINTTLSANGSITGTASVEGTYRIAATGTWSGTLVGSIKPAGHSTDVALTGVSYTADSIEDTVQMAPGDVIELTLSGATSPSIEVTVTQVL